MTRETSTDYGKEGLCGGRGTAAAGGSGGRAASVLLVALFASLLSGAVLVRSAAAIPAFARQYGASCSLCHAAYPRLNSFGEEFAARNMRLPGWRESSTMDTGDERLALPSSAPLAVRSRLYIQGRQGTEVDPVSGPTGNDADLDFQAPYLFKLFASAPLSDHITYYFYAIMAEKGANGEVVVEDAWIRHDDVFATGVALQLGQFQISDLMFPRETRMTFQDYMVYRMAGITYDRGLLADRDFGPVTLALGAANGNGISQNYSINSPGYRRPDHMFDNDRNKSVYGRVGLDTEAVSVGLFGLAGRQKNAAGVAGSGSRDTAKRIVGIDISGEAQGRLYWFVQLLWNRWADFIAEGRDYDWYGGFAGMDYVASEKWVFSLLYNYADAGDLDGTATAAYYFMTNVKGVMEVNYDFLGEDDDADYVGHETKEGYVLVGMDAAF
ncbi:MAG TPA: hypothetical protein ENJ37_02105 [Deltaproteobacteria bacterium]|nr:hypothetical protein [Deltaproteobacteria bacterium]